MSTTSNAASLSPVLKEKLNDHFNRLKKEQEERNVEKEMHIYNIESYDQNSNYTLLAFSPEDSYWMENIQCKRFDDCNRRGILYRPKIVKEIMTMVDNSFNKYSPTGIMIKGPHGIGKSHSLVNLVRNLQYNSSCKYLVTFIPECRHWGMVDDLYTAICSSFGTSLSALKWKAGSSLDKSGNLDTFVANIDLILQSMGKKWVLVFDQVNELFYRPELKEAEDVGSLPFPFSAINNIMKRGRRIVSIISASTDNEDAYKKSHEGFEEYNHPCNMDFKETCAAFEEVATRSNSTEIFEVTGGVPLQLKNLISFKFSIKEYERHELHSIRQSLEILRDEKKKFKFHQITESAVCCVLSTSGDEIGYDMKYSIRGEGKEAYHFKPLHPLVIVAYRRCFWESIMAFVHNHEQLLLNICAKPDSTNDVRDRIFELLVINRCSLNANIALKRLFQFKTCNLIEIFPSDYSCRIYDLPMSMEKDGMYVPRNSNFPAIDLIWKCGQSVCGVQVHISKHDNVLKKFTAMCDKAGWLTSFKNVYLLYLSPEQGIADSVQCNIPETQGPITVVALCKSSIPCLKTLQWPCL